MKSKIKKEFLGHTFFYKADIDSTTGNVLWSKEVDMQFSKWLYDLKAQDRELFKVQFSISVNAYKILSHLKDRLGVYDDSLLIRAITITFINYIDTKKGRASLKRLSDPSVSTALEHLKAGQLLKKNLYFSPNGMRDIVAYSNLTALRKSEVVQNAVYSVLLLSIQEEPAIKKFWEEDLLGQLSIIVKAA